MLFPLVILLFGVFLVSDGAFRRGLLITVTNLDETPANFVRLTEIVVGGVIFFLLGQLASKC